MNQIDYARSDPHDSAAEVRYCATTFGVPRKIVWGPMWSRKIPLARAPRWGRVSAVDVHEEIGGKTRRD